MPPGTGGRPPLSKTAAETPADSAETAGVARPYTTGSSLLKQPDKHERPKVNTASGSPPPAHCRARAAGGADVSLTLSPRRLADLAARHDARPLRPRSLSVTMTHPGAVTALSPLSYERFGAGDTRRRIVGGSNPGAAENEASMVDISRPDLPKLRRRRRMVMGGSVVVLLAVGSYAVSRLPPAAPVVDRGAVWIDRVRRGPMVRDVRGTGMLVPEDIRWIPAVAEGRVERIRLRPGAPVTPETVLLDLDSPELEQAVRDADRQWRVAEAEFANRRAELESALLTTQATLAALASEAREARIDADAEAQLHNEGLTSALSLRTKRARADNLEARLLLERQRLDLQRRSLSTQLAVPQAEVDRQRATLRLRQVQFAGLQVRAGVVGVLQQIAVELGARVAPGTNLARVVDPTRLKAELKVPETQAKDIKIGQGATVDTRHGVAAGRVSRIDPAAAGGTVAVEVTFDTDPPPGARPDLTVDGTIELERMDDVILVGRPAQGEEGATISLFRLDGSGHARRVQVTLGRMSVGLVEVRAGLSPGDEVILSDMSTWHGSDLIRVW